MSQAAVDYVKACTHPKVKDGVRAVFEAIADLVVEGHTTTPLIGMQAIAKATGLDRRTVLSRIEVLVTIGEVEVDGGQGKKARYTIVHLAGERPPKIVPLPLRADLQTVPAKAPHVDVVNPDAAPLVITDLNTPRVDRQHEITSWWQRVLVITSGLVLVITSWKKRRVHEELVITCPLESAEHVITSTQPALPLEIDDARARDVHTLKNVHTDGATPGATLSTGPPAIAHPWHAWCGLVCVPKKLHQAWLQKGHVEAWLFAFYARTCATMSAEQARLVVDEFRFWRTALAAELTPAAETRPPPNPRAAPSPDLRARERDEHRQRQGGGSR